MEYDAIILELLNRIKKLETEIEELKCVVNNDQAVQPLEETELLLENEEESTEETSTPRRHLTEEMMDCCYKGGKKAHAGANVPDLAANIAATTQMNESSAIIYLYAVKSMLAGQVYKRAISAKAIKKYFDNIYSEYGSAGLKKAIQATRQHVAYRRRFGHNVDSIESLCNEYESRL